MSFAVTVAAALLIVAIPASRNSVARQFHRVLDVIRIGPDTEVVQPDASTAGEVGATLQQHARELASGRMWSMHTAYGGFGGSVPPGASPALQRVDRLERLRSITSMVIQLPTFEYRGAIPRFSHALVAPDGLVLVFLGSGDRELLVVQAPVGGGRGMRYSRVIGGTDKQGRFSQHGSELRTEELLLGHQRVIWDPDTRTLSGSVPGSFSFTPQQATLQPTGNTTDVVSVIKGVIDAERGALEHYGRVIKACDGVDYVTQDMIIGILADEQQHLREFEGFLKEYEVYVER